MNTVARVGTIRFPQFSGLRCLMMPYIQGDPASLPAIYAPYRDIVESVFVKKGEVGYLTIDESVAEAGKPHRGKRAKFARALHTEAGKLDEVCGWGWGDSSEEPDETPSKDRKPQPQPKPKPKRRYRVTLDRGVRILLANNLDGSCAIWNTEHEDTTTDGDIGHVADLYPYDEAILMKAGEVHEIGILTPHESLPVPQNFDREFLRIVSAGVHGREPYFTVNPLM